MRFTVDVNGKKKTFWIADPSQGCTDSIPVTPPAPVVKCANRSGYFGDSLTSDYAVLNPGSGIGILYQGKVAIDLSMVEYSIDGVVTSNIALDPHADGTVGIWAFTDPGIADGAHTATVKINLGDGSCASKSWNFTTLGSGGAT